MNPYYQYFLASGGAVSGSPVVDPLGTGTIIGSPVASPAVDPVVSPVVEPVVEPVGTGTIATNPATDPVTSPTPTSTVGGGTVAAPAGTTINIFGSGTTTTTGAGQVAVDTDTGIIATSVTDPNAAIDPPLFGGGGGGGGGMMGGGDEGEGQVGGVMPRVRTIIPLIVIAAGIAVFIIKPFKK